MTNKTPLQTSNFRKASLALIKTELSVHEAARNVQIIGTLCVIAVQLVYTIILYM